MDVDILEHLVRYISPWIELGWSHVGGSESSPVIIDVSEDLESVLLCHFNDGVQRDEVRVGDIPRDELANS